MAVGTSERLGRSRWGAAFVLVLLLVGLGAAAAAAPRTAVGTGSGAPEQWAYGADTWYNTTSITSTYELHEVIFYGSQVVTTATNTSGSTVELRANSTAAYSESYLLCEPNCTTPSTEYYNLSLSEWTYETSLVNVTSNAVVYENNSSAHHGVTAAAAYGMSNATWLSHSNYSEQYRYDLHGTPNFRGNDFSQTDSSYRVSFSPAIGLIPWSLSTNLTWNASSNVNATYHATTAYYVSYNGLHNYTILEYGTTHTQWNIPETEAVQGEDLGTTALSGGGNATSIELGFSGALNVADGIFASPVSADLFGGATGNWTVGVVAGALAHTSAMSVTKGGAAYHIVAATTSWSAPFRLVGVQPQSYSSLPTALSATPSGNSLAQPESVAYAASAARCLIGACSAGPSGAPAPQASGLVVPTWVIAVVSGATIAVLVALAVLMRRRRNQPSAAGAPSDPVRSE